MSKAIIRIACTIIVGVTLCLALSAVLTAILPIFGNYISQQQLENSNNSFLAMQALNLIQNAVALLQCGIAAVCAISIGVDVYTIIKIKSK